MKTYLGKKTECTSCGVYIGGKRIQNSAKCLECFRRIGRDKARKLREKTGKKGPNTECGGCGIFIGTERYHRQLKCRPCAIKEASVRSKGHREKLNEEVVLAYGSKCECCGESDSRFLTIHHRFNDGAQERKLLRKSATSFRYWLKEKGFPTDRYALYCMNCNAAEEWHGECPHKTDRREQGL